nr:ABC transporter substrate binding protein [uncultured Marinifilum sp.]
MRIKQCIFLLSLLLFTGLSAYSAKNKNILVLVSYHNGLSWTDSLVNSIKNEFLSNNDYTVFIEYMDTKRYFSESHLSDLKNHYKKKFHNTKFDVIISTDNNAYNFLKDNRNDIFGPVPVLFSGLNSIIDPPKGYSGVFENFSFCATLSLINKFHPNYSKIVVVSDYSTTGKTLLDALNKDIKQMSEPLRYDIIRPKSIEDLKNKMSKLDSNSVVLYLVYNRDINGNYCTYESGFKQAKPYCKVPIYCVWDFYIDRGAIGGSLITGRIHGKQVSDMAKKVLSGTSVDDIPPLKAEYKYIFDYKEMSRFGIKKRDLPKNSKILNIPYSFVRENKEIVVLTITVLVLLTVIIIVLMINMHLRKLRAQKEKAHLTEIKASNKKLAKAKIIAEESSRLKSAFLANMSHEIRTPMNAILGFTELLSGDNVEDSKRKRFISIIQKNTNSLLRLISDILDISKIETNQLKIIIDAYKISDLFESVKSNYESMLDQNGNKKLDFKISLPETNEIIEISTDIIRLQQVFSNLLENSLKFTNQGEIEIGYMVKGKYLEFFVRDTGIGIEENKQAIIFDRFRQAELDANTRKYGGTGLGLAICKSLIELLGGTIRMKSKLNKGTIFYFTIPI